MPPEIQSVIPMKICNSSRLKPHFDNYASLSLESLQVNTFPGFTESCVYFFKEKWRLESTRSAVTRWILKEGLKRGGGGMVTHIPS